MIEEDEYTAGLIEGWDNCVKFVEEILKRNGIDERIIKEIKDPYKDDPEDM